MRTLAIVGTGGGVGTTTLTALAFGGLRTHGQGSPMLYARPSAHLVERVGSDEVAAINGDVAVWDAGVHTPESSAALLEAGGCVLTIAAPATALGVADVLRFLGTIAELGEDALGSVVVVLSQVNGPGRPAPSSTIPGSMVLRMPYDRVLARPGPVPQVASLGRATRVPATAWQRRAASLLLS